MKNHSNLKVYQISKIHVHIDINHKKHTISPIQVEKHSQKIHTFCCINWYGKSNIRVYIENTPKKKEMDLEKILANEHRENN